MFAVFLQELYASSVYKGWAKQHALEAGLWKAYAGAIQAGQAPKPPAFTSAFGNALLQVALLARSDAAHSSYGSSTYG